VVVALLALLPAALAGPWSPSGLVLQGPTAPLVASAGGAGCVDCHADATHSWAGSAHAHASLDNPWYLASLQALRAEAGPTASRHCGGCHDPALLVTGALDDAELSADQALADAGVGCLMCHAQASATPDGNASLTLQLADLPDPRTDVDAHAERMRPDGLSDGSVCQGCHRGTLVPQMGAPRIHPGFDDWGSWQGSSWAGTDADRLEPDPPRATCVDCHDHRMVGGRTALSTEHLLDDAVALYLPRVWVDGVAAEPDALSAPEGAEVVVEAVVHNTNTGHRFPGGLGDTQDTWLQLTLTDADGGVHSLDGPHLRALPLDEQGVPVLDHQPHRVAVGAFDHTVPPGEAQVLRVAFLSPGGPMQLSAELLHRAHRPELADAACAVTTEHTLDGCAPLPLTVVAHARDDAGWAPWYALALGYSRGTTDDLPQAHAALDRALAEGLPAVTASVIRARVLGRQGRVDEAVEALADAPDHPAVWRARGVAQLAAWRFGPAAEALAHAARLAPLHVPTWRDLARARGSLGDDGGALAAADAGLALAPRDPDLLRSRALTLRALDHADAEQAEAAWLAHRLPDGLHQLRIDCDRRFDACAERASIPTTWAELGPPNGESP
jgi:Flp pilus assembly protein TadD